MVFEKVLNPVFSPLLFLPTFLAIIIISFLISMITLLITKYTTDQKLMKQLKEEMKQIQKEMKELRKSPSDAKSLLEVNKRFMQTHRKYMSHSFRSMLFTFIPLIVIYSWMNANLAFEPLIPDKDFNVTALFSDNAAGEISLMVPDGLKIIGDSKKKIEGKEVKWLLNGNAGEYLLEFEFNKQKYDTELIVTTEHAYKSPVKKIKDSFLKEIRIENAPKKLINLFGWKIGWLGTYFIFSIIFSLTLRKVIKVY